MFSVKSTHGFLQCLRPIGLGECCIQKAFSIRRYNPPSNDDKNDALKNWTKNGLYDLGSESVSKHNNTSASSSAAPVSELGNDRDDNKNYMRRWPAKSGQISICTANQSGSVTRGESTRNVPVPQSIMLALRESRNSYDIDRAFRACQYDFETFKSQSSSEAYSQLVQSLFIAEFRLRNFTICEGLFSECIKYSAMNPEVVEMGLVTFVKNKNLTLAKEFYAQALKDLETFPMTPHTLHAFTFEIFKSSDLPMMKRVIHLWLEELSNTEMIPLSRTFSLFHRLLLKNEDHEGLLKFLAHPTVQSSGYMVSADYLLCTFRHELAAIDALNEEIVREKMEELLPRLAHERRIDLYIEILKVGVARNNFSIVKFATKEAQEDEACKINDNFHKHACHYFVKNGMLRALVQYLKEAVLPHPTSHLGHVYVEQLWKCALQNYPMLSKEYTNTFQLVLNRESLLREYDWLSYTVRKEIPAQFALPGFPVRFSAGSCAHYNLQLGPSIRKRLQKGIAGGDFVETRKLVIDELRQGIRPDFPVLYSLLKTFLNECIDSATSIDQIMREIYHKIPLKVEILWLKHYVLESLKPASRAGTTLESTHQAALAAAMKVKDFEREHRMALNFQNYMQLSSLCLALRDAKKAAQLVGRGKKLLNPLNRRDWLIFYSNALKVYTRCRDPVKFLSTLNDWNANPEAWLITQNEIRSCKGYVKYFEKTLEATPQNESHISEIRAGINLLRERYVNIKFQGLDDMRMVSAFLQDWIKQDLDAKKKDNPS